MTAESHSANRGSIPRRSIRRGPRWRETPCSWQAMQIARKSHPEEAASNALSLSKGWFVYIVFCADASYYVGHAQDVTQRVVVHNRGDGAAWTRRRRPVTLAYYEEQPDETSAVKRER